jgi:hypothetical protein
MALKNYLYPGTYSVLGPVQFSKQQRWLRFTLNIYTDDTKEVELAKKEYEISSYTELRGVKNTTTTTPPIDPALEDAYLITAKATDEWAGHENQLAVWMDTPDGVGWCYWFLGNKQIFFDESIGEYIQIEDTKTARFTKVYPTDDIRIWNKWFAPSIVFSADSNLHKQCYAFLKSTKGFENVKDV